MKKAVFFDLDGTLLPMDYDLFIKCYFGALAKKLAPYGYEPDALIQAVWSGTKAMQLNDGGAANETRFWDRFAEILGEDVREQEKNLEDFYRNEFIAAKQACGFSSKAEEAAELVRAKGMKCVLATNPIFPMVATETRLGWAGLTPAHFDCITTYDNSRYCKPNPDYYREICEKLNLDPADCAMVGNDVTEDMAAAQLGMDVFLLTDCILNKENRDISGYPQGGFDELISWINNL
ncbi:MAG: HAD family hydrolase [Clostridia bacterium]|nr:HAD family hydrolase [Clostridia bacterium]